MYQKNCCEVMPFRKLIIAALFGLAQLIASPLRPQAAEPTVALTLAELMGLEQRVQDVATRCVEATVAIVGSDPERPGQGSGVVVSRDGLILTAAHVLLKPGKDMRVIF